MSRYSNVQTPLSLPISLSLPPSLPLSTSLSFALSIPFALPGQDQGRLLRLKVLERPLPFA